MIYKVGDKVRVRKDISVKGNWGFVEGMEPFIGKVVTISRLVDTLDDEYDEYLILEDNGDYAWTEEMFEGLANEAPSIVKRINDKHHILNGLLNSDGSVSGEKLMQALEADSAKEGYYEKSAMQPLEVSQVLLTKEQFEGALLFNIIKYRMRSNFKGQHDSDEYKARQYAYWLEMVKDGHIINPSKDKVPSDYRFSII